MTFNTVVCQNNDTEREEKPTKMLFAYRPAPSSALYLHKGVMWNHVEAFPGT